MKNKATQIYGYVVCVVCVITFLITIGGLITSLIDKGDPLHSTYQSELNLSSFENYKVDAMKSINSDAAYIPDDSTLKSMYESAKADLLARRSHMIHRNIIVNSIVMTIAILLFLIHWKWLVKAPAQTQIPDNQI